MHHCRKCGHPVNLTEDEKREVIERFMRGESPTSISRELRLSRNTVYRITDRARHPEEPGQGALFQETPNG